MRGTLLLLLLAGGVAGGAAAGGPEPVGVRFLQGLKLANDNKDASRLAAALTRVRADNVPSAVRDELAKELCRSLAVFRKNMGIERDVLEALGDLRSPRALRSLKKFALRKDVENDRDVSLQVTALQALGKYRDPKFIGAFERVLKSRNIDVAKAAYATLANYDEARARVRKRVSKLLVKRLLLEFPAYSNSNGKWISDEKRRRWRSVSTVIVSSLQSVTHESTINDVENWRRWWSENKNKPWKDPPGAEEPDPGGSTRS